MRFCLLNLQVYFLKASLIIRANFYKKYLLKYQAIYLICSVLSGFLIKFLLFASIIRFIGNFLQLAFFYRKQTNQT
jgi:hypothetical protein